MHPRNFGSPVTVRTPDRPSVRATGTLIWKTQSKGMATQMQLKVLFGMKSHGRQDF